MNICVYLGCRCLVCKSACSARSCACLECSASICCCSECSAAKSCASRSCCAASASSSPRSARARNSSPTCSLRSYEEENQRLSLSGHFGTLFNNNRWGEGRKDRTPRKYCNGEKKLRIMIIEINLFTNLKLLV